MHQFALLKIEPEGALARIVLNRPDAHNAFNGELIYELRAAFEALSADGEARVLILTGAGKSFCAGADLNYMKSMASYGPMENSKDARELSDMFAAIRSCPKPVIGMINGAAIGGGAGLAAVCDIAIAAESAAFAFSEVKLGLVPAVISPYVVERIGPSAARRLFMTGERFDARTAARLGLVDAAVPDDILDSVVAEQARQLLSSGPKATGEAKRLVEACKSMPADEIRMHAVAKIAELRGTPEGQEGMAAFLEKRKPSWNVK
ncbi:MAG: enoyl-CoA hydratase-related protein [Methanobacteriota archaeon]